MDFSWLTDMFDAGGFFGAYDKVAKTGGQFGQIAKGAKDLGTIAQTGMSVYGLTQLPNQIKTQKEMANTLQSQIAEQGQAQRRMVEMAEEDYNARLPMRDQAIQSTLAINPEEAGNMASNDVRALYDRDKKSQEQSLYGMGYSPMAVANRLGSSRDQLNLIGQQLLSRRQAITTAKNQKFAQANALANGASPANIANIYSSLSPISGQATMLGMINPSSTISNSIKGLKGVSALRAQ